tara:strand:- start:20880 stop:21587 length:708 start_codon:yes stop_codon:yes gene_type:complete
MLRGLPDGLDGELIVGSPTEGHVLNRTQSGIMSSDGTPDFTYWVFDNYAAEGGWVTRNNACMIDHPRVEGVEHYLVYKHEDLLAHEQVFLEDGYEGLMVRAVHGPYKHGRSTLSEGFLCKWKRFTDGEATVYSLLEGVHNENVLTRSATGAAQRSHHQEGKTPAGVVGTILANDCVTGALMSISPGRMTHDMRKYYWDNRHELVGKVIKYKSFEYGKKDNTRFATFQDFRHAEDM